MKTLRNILFSFAFVVSNAVFAEDIVQVVPFRTTAGKTNGDFYIAMNNSSPILSMDFTLVLPEGMELYSMGSFSLVEDRNKYSDDEVGEITQFQTVGYNILGNGKVRVTTYNNYNLPFAGTSGNILKVRYKTTASMRSGLYPIQVLDNNMALSTVDHINPENSSSYVIVGEDYSMTDENGFADLSSLDGYIPSFVVNSINSEIGENSSLTGIDLTKATKFGAKLNAANKNALVYLGTNDTEIETDANLVIDSKCANLELIDNLPFYNARAFEAASVSYTRTMSEHKWGTLCLPFEVEPNETAKVYQMTAVSDGVMTFSPVESSAAYNPCIIKKLSTDDKITFTAENATIAVTPEAMSVVTGQTGWTLVGTMAAESFDGNASSSLYFINGDLFWKAGTSGLNVAPFRAYFETTTSNGAKFRIEEGTSGIEAIEADVQQAPVYNLQGNIVSKAQRGQVYIKDNAKYIIK